MSPSAEALEEANKSISHVPGGIKEKPPKFDIKLPKPAIGIPPVEPGIVYIQFDGSIYSFKDNRLIGPVHPVIPVGPDQPVMT